MALCRPAALPCPGVCRVEPEVVLIRCHGTGVRVCVGVRGHWRSFVFNTSYKLQEKLDWPVAPPGQQTSTSSPPLHA